MSYIPNIQGLRFIERDGKKVLQQLVYRPPDGGVSFHTGSLSYVWEDVPFEEGE